MGAEILFYPTAIGWATSQDEATNSEQFNAWQTIQKSHAVANGLHVVSVNRVGFEQQGAMKFWGGSFISNPFGRIIYQASHDKEEVHVEEVDSNKRILQNPLAISARPENRFLSANYKKVY